MLHRTDTKILTLVILDETRVAHHTQSSGKSYSVSYVLGKGGPNSLTTIGTDPLSTVKQIFYNGQLVMVSVKFSK